MSSLADSHQILVERLKDINNLENDESTPVVVNSVKAGMTYRLACVRVDIDESTLYRWLTAGETQVRGQFCEFRKEFMRALADSAESLRLG